MWHYTGMPCTAVRQSWCHSSSVTWNLTAHLGTCAVHVISIAAANAVQPQAQSISNADVLDEDCTQW
jgi:hypothetical protein